MVFYNRISRIWTVDFLDCFLIGVFFGSVTALWLKKRLKNSIINESKLKKKQNL